jgi:hypothetical protein
MSTALTLSGLQNAQIDILPEVFTRRDIAVLEARQITSIGDAFEAEIATDALRGVSVLAKEIEAYGGAAVELSFEQGPMPVVGSPCSLVKGTFAGGRRFWLCFTAEDIGSAKTIALAEAGAEASLLESFLIDEKKMTLALLVSRVVSRLNGQKWLGAN